MLRITPDPVNAERPLLDHALDYLRRGWTVFPVVGKKPVCRWKSLQTVRPDEAALRRLFGQHPNATGIAVLTGSASGGLACRDFDDTVSYWKWGKEHPELAASLPTVATARGWHVWFLHSTDEFIKLDDGELRADSGHYTLLPPSRHPDGPAYSWTVPLQAARPPVIDPVEVGLVPLPSAGHLRLARSGNLSASASVAQAVEGEQEEGTEHTPHGNNHIIAYVSEYRTDQVGESSSVEDLVSRAIATTLPTGSGQRNRHLFQFARALKGIPELADAEPIALKPYVLLWWKAARPFIRTKEWNETWKDFVTGWHRVQVPQSLDRRQILHAAARQAEAEPMAPAAGRYGDPKVQKLVAVCRVLQRLSREGTFYLSCRDAAELAGMGHHDTAASWLKKLAQDRVLEVVRPGMRRPGPDGQGGSGFATEYRYIAEDLGQPKPERQPS